MGFTNFIVITTKADRMTQGKEQVQEVMRARESCENKYGNTTMQKHKDNVRNHNTWQHSSRVNTDSFTLSLNVVICPSYKKVTVNKYNGDTGF